MMQHIQNNALLNACQTGNISAVENIVKTLQSDEICLPGTDANTALHIAVVNAQPQIVSLLIARCCARTNRNTNGKTAFEEAPNSTIQTMLLRSRRRYARFEQKPVFFTDSAFGIWRYIVNGFRLVECEYYEKEGVEERRLCALAWLESSLTDDDERHLIASYFKRAFAEDSAKPILMALTEETSVYELLNCALVNEREDRVFEKNELHGPLLITRNLFKAVYDGKHGENYDGLALFAKATLSRSDVKWFTYKIKQASLSLKTFWSVTKTREIATARNGNVLFILECKELSTKRTLCLDEISGYPDEKEVLLAPMTKMEVVQVQRVNNDEYEIHINYWDW